MRGFKLICFFAAGTMLFIGCQPKNSIVSMPPPKVTVVHPTIETITIFLEENGETEAVEQATVRARVQGLLQEIKFDPDDVIAEGDELYVIEQAQYIAAVQSFTAAISSANAELGATKASIGVAEAQVAASVAAINVAKAEFGRMDNLLKNNAVSQSEWDSAKAALEQAQAALKGTEANRLSVQAKVTQAEALVEKANADLKQAELDLEWTVVTAPIGGRMMRTLVKRGNLVDSGTELVTIIQGDQIWANFSISERLLMELENRTGEKKGAADPTKFAAFLQRSGDTDFPFEGHLDYIDAQVDSATGTLGIRAVFQSKNAERILIPGMFVRVRVPIGVRENATLIPERAISKDQVGSFVYVVDDANIVTRKNVVLGPSHDENIVVESGLTDSEWVIVDGIQRARPGSPVDPVRN